MNNNNNNKTKPSAAKKKSTTPTKTLTRAKKARGDKTSLPDPSQPVIETEVKRVLRNRSSCRVFLLKSLVNGRLDSLKLANVSSDRLLAVLDEMCKRDDLLMDGDRYWLPRTAKKRPALNRFTKKARKEAKTYKKNLLTRAMMAAFIKDALSQSDEPLVGWDIWAEVGGKCHVMNFEPPPREEIRDVVDLMFRSGQLVRVGSDRFKLPEEEAPSTTPSGKGEVITADSVKVKTRGSTKRPATPSLTLAAGRIDPTADFSEKEVVDHLRPVCDAAMAVLSHPHPCRRDDMVELAMISPGPLETTFDRLFGEKPTYILKWTLIRPIMVGRIATEVLLEVRGETPLVAAQHFLAEMRYLASVRLNERPAHQATACARNLARAVEAAQKKLPGCALDIVTRLFP